MHRQRYASWHTHPHDDHTVCKDISSCNISWRVTSLCILYCNILLVNVSSSLTLQCIYAVSHLALAPSLSSPKQLIFLLSNFTVMFGFPQLVPLVLPALLVVLLLLLPVSEHWPEAWEGSSSLSRNPAVLLLLLSSRTTLSSSPHPPVVQPITEDRGGEGSDNCGKREKQTHGEKGQTLWWF